MLVNGNKELNDSKIALLRDLDLIDNSDKEYINNIEYYI